MNIGKEEEEIRSEEERMRIEEKMRGDEEGRGWNRRGKRTEGKG